MSLRLVGLHQATCTLRPLLTLAKKGITDYTLYAPDVLAGEHKVRLVMVPERQKIATPL
jgi:glutathione S-transferase